MFSPSLYTGMTIERAGSCPGLPRSDSSNHDLLADPGNDFIEHLVEVGARLEPEDRPGLANIRAAKLHVILVGRVVDDLEWPVGPVDLAPDPVGELDDGRRLVGGQIEILVPCRRALDAQPDAARQVAAVGVMAHLATVTEDVEGILTTHHL